MRDNIIIHLANVLYIAEADGTLSEIENAALGDVMARIGANDDDVVRARTLIARSPAYRLLPLPDVAANMRMIEDMVLVALADGQVSPYESRPLEAFLSERGFVQADMDMVVQRIRTRLHDLAPPPSGETSPLRPRTARSSTERNRRAAASPAALPTPRATPTTTPRIVQSPPPLTAPEPLRQAPQPAPPPNAFRPQAPDESSLPSPPAASVLPPTATAREASAEVPYAACARIREQSPFGSCHCFGVPEGPLNPWGCRLVEMAWDGEASWLRLGRFRDNDTFVFDRDAISEKVQTRLDAFRECPFLLGDFAAHALLALPLRATTAGRWRHHLASQTTVSDAIPVTVRTYNHGCVRQKAVLSDGMSPTDDRDARLMIRRTAMRTRAPLDLAMLDERKGDLS